MASTPSFYKQERNVYKHYSFFIIQCIHISGASIVFDIDSFPNLDHVTAAATCIATATRWIELKIELIKYLENLDDVNPDLCVYHKDNGTEEIFIKGGLVEAIHAAAHAQGKGISCEIIEEYVPLGFDSTMYLSGSDTEDTLRIGEESGGEESVVISGMMSVILVVTTEVEQIPTRQPN
jgi:hypothetical protein